jgi:predicted AlkP superfamily pyrophosphatase or phosphodiesterase
MLKQVLVLLFAATLSAQTRALVFISIDGLPPAYLNDADKYQLKIPTLRRLMAEGAHAESVRNVMPSVTYPNHTTLITGVLPVRHGILQNTTFDPEHKNLDGWYWYSEDIKVPTLWDVAAKAGWAVGSVSWPVSVGARGVSYLIPEYWRSMTADDRKLVRALSTPGLAAELEPEAGQYITDLSDAVPGDWVRTRYAVGIIRRKHARFITVHLAALDHLEHEDSPFSPEAFATLEEIDKMVASIETAMRAETPETAVCIVSDHGFAKIDHQLNLRATMKGWKATPWGTGGSAFIVLKDASARAEVEKQLKQLAADPANGIDHIMDRKELASLGAAPNADFAVDMKPGFTIGTGEAPGVVAIKPGGTHGYSPEHPEMRASFVIAGPGIKRGVSLVEIDMRSIAPTLAKVLGSSLPTADLPPLAVFTVLDK